MLQQNIILLALFALGIIFNNSLIAAGSGILLILRFVRLNSMLVLLEQRAMEAGLLLLLIAVFVPFAQDKVTLPEVAKTFVSIDGIIAIISGMGAAFMCGCGVNLLETNPQIAGGLVIGSILGVLLLKGIPIGPLAAAGMAAMLLKLISLWRK
ncbi:MAG TPA: DUF441 domain-containing protein [Firmicutes bacterium]|jgi:uncharacterized membrane protein (DUF441 family)|nr:DUF441 domain-containing protein [Bacillota bacterium]HCF93114.1 DUF441 domain-containing protein [Bacillota bacterium]HCM19064.1 DUF441 domain-containing protein [Bacillota bacterium]HCT35952.1 DUF441 domain-containing protein [Bacillota bacterium]HCX69758.1 DUF441 domain-containing protein [Bacillota bacterium]